MDDGQAGILLVEKQLPQALVLMQESSLLTWKDIQDDLQKRWRRETDQFHFSWPRGGGTQREKITRIIETIVHAKMAQG